MPAASQGKRGHRMPQFPPFDRERAPGATSSAPGQSEGCSQPVPQGQGTPSLGNARAASHIPQARGYAPQFPGLLESWAAPGLSPLWEGRRYALCNLFYFFLEQVHCF